MKSDSTEDDQNYVNRLSDDLLLEILKFVDTKTAVSTGMLSSRWRNVFHSLSHFKLSVNCPEPNIVRADVEIDQYRVRNFEDTATTLLNPAIFPYVNSLEIRTESQWHWFRHQDPNFNECIKLALNGQLEHLTLAFGNFCHRQYEFPFHFSDGFSGHLRSLVLRIAS